MELIATHVGADFDAFASVIVAQRLHPGARIFFPGSQEESVRRLVSTGLVAFEELRQRQIDPRRLSRVVLCDSRRRDRIGVVAEWLGEAPAVEVLAYDHHAATEVDLPVAGGVIDPEVGSTSTLMVELVRHRGIELPANEATVLLMGIYEDTASMTYATTAPRDLEAAAWLLAHGADLATVRRFALPHLDPQRLDVLHGMSEALEVHSIHGHRIGVVAMELGEYIEELAPLVSRCLQIFDLPLIFAVLGEGDGASIIARGEIPGFELGEALVAFGGGGHSTAASARVKGVTTLELRERLLADLEESLPPAARAAEVMIADFFCLPPGATVAEAKQLLNARRVNAAPVLSGEGGERIVGAVSRQTLDAALQHGLAERPVETVMAGDLVWVPPEAPVEEVGRRMLSRHPRFVLVGDEAAGKAVGLVTRMGVLRYLHSRNETAQKLDRRSLHQREKTQKAASLMDRQLAPELRRRIDAIAQVARRHEISAYLVGGFVRDLLLRRENRDLDVVVEGDGLHFARLLAAELGGRVREHREFLTAVVIAADGRRVDVASARSEFYRAPAALPEVQTSPLRQDLYRRDFTVNALALRLYPGKEPEIIDYFSGRQDLEAGVLRVLHSLSFIDDPTRAFRAVRLEQRLGFHISPETVRLLEVALAEGVFDRLSGRRLLEELRLLLDDPATALPGVERLEELELLWVVHPSLELTPSLRAQLREAVAACDWFRLEEIEQPRLQLWLLLLRILVLELRPGERRTLAQRLGIVGESRKALERGLRRLEPVRQTLRRHGVRPHEVAEALAPLDGEEILWLMASETGTARAWVRRCLTDFRQLAPRLRGADLVAAGVPQGPEIGRAIRAVHRARLDGDIGPEEELAYALRSLGMEEG